MSVSEALSVFPTSAERGSLEAVTEGDSWQVYTVTVLPMETFLSVIARLRTSQDSMVLLWNYEEPYLLADRF